MAKKRELQTDEAQVFRIDELKFTDVFDLAEIQKIQDAFAEATGVASIITDTDGVPITAPSQFCEMCQLVRATELGRANCYKSDAELGKPHPGGPILQPCLSGGLWDGGVSIYLGDRHIGNWLIGQILTSDAEVGKVLAYGEKVGVDPEAFREAVSKVTRMSLEQFEKVGQALYVFSQQLSRMALQNAQQKIEIARRERAEQDALRPSGLFTSGPVMIFRWQNAPGWPVEYVSPNITDILGYTPEQLISGEIPYASIVHPDDLARVATEVQTYSAAGIPTFSQEYRMLTANGAVRWLYDQTRIVRDAAGAITHYDGYMQDITERKQAETESLRLTAILENTSDMVSIAMPDGRLTYMNKAGWKMVGWPADEDLRKHTIPDVHPAWALEKIEKVGMPTAIAQGLWQGESALLRVDGTEIPVSQVIMAHKSSSGEVEYLSTVMRDISEMRAAQTERERFITRLGTAAEIAGRAAAILNPDELLNTVIPLIKERFGLYYVHVYTLDAAAGLLHLRAGYGEPGRIMLERGHSIPLDREASLVATAARTQTLVLVNDVTQNPNFMPNPLLPDTKAEVAVPAIAGGKVLGVFDVQHDVVGYFTQADLDVFLTLAGQIATAFQNARYVEEVARQRAFYDGIITNLPVGVWAVDQQFKPLLVNPAGRAMMGREVKDEGGGAYVESYEVININTGEPYDNTQLPLVKAVTQGGTYTAVDAGVRWPDGTVVPQIINAAPLLDPDGTQTGAVVIFIDATEQRQAQAAAERERDRAQMYLNVAGSIIVVLNPQGEVVLLNRQGLEILGYTEQEILGQNWFDFTVPEALRDGVKGVFADIMAGKIAQAAYYENEITNKDGEQRLIAWHNSLLKDADGRISGVLSSGDDITERKRAEAALRESQQKFQTVADFTYDWEYWIGVGEEMLYVSPACEKITGYTAAEFVENPHLLDEIVLPEDQETLHRHIYHYHDNPDTLATAREAGEVEFRIVRKDGEVRWIGHACQPVYGQAGEWLGRRASNRDMTAAVAAQRALESNQRLLQQFLDNFPDLAFAKDSAGRIILANRALYQFFPVSDGVLLGKTVHDLVPADLADGIWRSELTVLEKGATLEFEEVVPQQGEVHTKLTTKFPLYDAEGKVTALGGVSLDITERKRAEAELEQFAAHLRVAAEVTTEISAILDADTLFETLVRLTKERFNLYHAQYYDLDEATQTLTLRFGYGQAGQMMKQRKYHLPLKGGRDLAARAAHTREVVVAHDLTQEADYTPNMLLLDARSEVALPLIVGGRVLGVLDVLADQTGYFTPTMVDVLRTVMGQVVTTLQNVQYFAQQKAAENALRSSSEQIRAMFDAMGDGVIVNNMTGEITDMNEASFTLMGYIDREDLLHHNILELIAPANRAQTSVGWVTTLESGSSGMQTVMFQRKDGSTFAGELTSALLQDAEGNPVGFINIVRQTTDHAG